MRVDLEAAKKHAISHNFEVTSLRRELEEAQAASRRVKAAYYPRLGIAGGAETQGSTNTSQQAVLAYAYLDYNLFRGFEDSYRSEMADIEADKRSIRLKRSEFRVGLEVEQQFYLYLFKKLTLELKKKAVELNEALKHTAKQRRASGLSSDSDILEFDLRDSLLKSDIATVDQELEESRVNLKRLLGEEIGSKIEPVGELHHLHLKGNLMDYMNRIKGESEGVQVTSRELAKATVESKLWRSKWIPTIDLQTSVGYLPLDRRPALGGVGFQGQILAKFDIFAGFETYWEKQEGEAKRLKLESQLKQVLLLAVSQMEVAYRKIKAIETKVHLEEENEARAKKYYTSVFSEYKRGVKNSADVRVAAENLFDATLRRESFKYDFVVQKIELERALGGAVDVEVATGVKPH